MPFVEIVLFLKNLLFVLYNKIFGIETGERCS
jgi:hypothetical protein